MLKNATPWLISGFAFLGQAMSSSTAGLFGGGRGDERLAERS